MHRSRLAAVVIDSRTDDLDKEAAFWGAALGMSVSTPNGSDRYRDVTGPADQPKVLVQQVEHESRVHLDIETDDRSEEHTSELQSLMRISYAVFCLKKKNNIRIPTNKTLYS